MFIGRHGVVVRVGERTTTKRKNVRRVCSAYENVILNETIQLLLVPTRATCADQISSD
jgi:hypothetical protein